MRSRAYLVVALVTVAACGEPSGDTMVPDAGAPVVEPPVGGAPGSAPVPGPPPPATRSGSVDCATGFWLDRTPLERPSSWPAPRGAFAHAWDTDRHLLLVSGGYPTDLEQQSLFWNQNEGTWSNVTTPDAFGPRLGHVVEYDSVRKQFIAWGGMARVSGTPLSDGPFVLAPADGPWRPFIPAGDGPGSATAIASVYDRARDRFVVSGGYTNRSGAEWSSEKQEWTKLGQSPPFDEPLIGHALVFDSLRERIYWLGGRSAGPHVWHWDVANETFTAIDSAGGGPLPQDWFGATYDARRDKVMVFGGYRLDGGGRRVDTLWQWDPATGEWALCDGGDVTPAARMNTALVYDEEADSLVLFGGTGDNGELADVWNWYIP